MGTLTTTDVKHALETLAAVFAQKSDRTQPKNSLAKVIDLLEGAPGLSVEDFAAQLTQTQTKPTPTKRPAKPLNEHLVAAYMRDLKEANGDSDRFEAVLTTIAADRGARVKVELKAIASQYAGGSITYSSKLKALEAMRESFRVRQIAEQKVDSARRSRPW